jgi:hypothetical protein
LQWHWRSGDTGPIQAAAACAGRRIP